jgi:hypothetical protein
MSNFVFNEELHKYTLDGVVLPSVTQIMKPLYDFSTVNRDVLARAGAFGTAVHKTIELYLADDLDEDGLDENLYNPLLAFKAWQSDFYEYEITTSANIEVPGYHEKLKYAGTPDVETKNFLIDLKSRPVNMLTDPIQLAAYDNMTGSGGRERFVLELKQDASYVFTCVNRTKKLQTESWQRFRYLLDLHKMNEEVSRWKTK